MTPQIIREQHEKLVDLMNKDNSPSLSVRDVAEWFGVDYQCMLKSIEQGNCPFGIGGKNPNGNRFAKVNKEALWNWVMKGVQM